MQHQQQQQQQQPTATSPQQNAQTALTTATLPITRSLSSMSTSSSSSPVQLTHCLFQHPVYSSLNAATADALTSPLSTLPPLPVLALAPTLKHRCLCREFVGNVVRMDQVSPTHSTKSMQDMGGGKTGSSPRSPTEMLVCPSDCVHDMLNAFDQQQQATALIAAGTALGGGAAGDQQQQQQPQPQLQQQLQLPRSYRARSTATNSGGKFSNEPISYEDHLTASGPSRSHSSQHHLSPVSVPPRTLSALSDRAGLHHKAASVSLYASTRGGHSSNYVHDGALIAQAQQAAAERKARNAAVAAARLEMEEDDETEREEESTSTADDDEEEIVDLKRGSVYGMGSGALNAAALPPSSSSRRASRAPPANPAYTFNVTNSSGSRRPSRLPQSSTTHLRPGSRRTSAMPGGGGGGSKRGSRMPASHLTVPEEREHVDEIGEGSLDESGVEMGADGEDENGVTHQEIVIEDDEDARSTRASVSQRAPASRSASAEKAAARRAARQQQQLADQAAAVAAEAAAAASIHLVRRRDGTYLNPPLSRRDPDPSKNIYTWDEIRRHSTKKDCWLVVKGKVYDVSAFIPLHPAGVMSIARHAGTDSTTHFDFHSGDGQKLWKSYEIGQLEGAAKENCVIM